jgi:regulator of sigma E protease
LTYAAAIAALAFLIIIHELGHFVVARTVSMRPRKFYLFFPPAIWKTTRGGIEYGIGAIPLGGYVKIPGMHRPAAGDLEAHLGPAVHEAPWLDKQVKPAARALDEEREEDARAALAELRTTVDRADISEGAKRSADRGLTDLDDALSSDAYWRAPTWKRVAVIFAGPGVNLLFAIALLAVVFWLGVPTGTRVASVDPASPAMAAGLYAGDRVVSVDGHELTPVLTDTITAAIQASDGRPVTLVVERDGKLVTLAPATPMRIEGSWRLGFRAGATTQESGPAESVGLAFRETWAITSETGKALVGVVTGSRRDEVSSPIGIVEGSSEALKADFVWFLRIVALISLSLAILNLLPLLPLDGGHIAFSLMEGARGRAIPRVAYERASAIGIALVLFLFFIGVSNDVGRLGGG